MARGALGRKNEYSLILLLFILLALCWILFTSNQALDDSEMEKYLSGEFKIDQDNLKLVNFVAKKIEKQVKVSNFLFQL